MEEGDIRVKAAGLNHFSCAIEIRNARDGRDLYPDVRVEGVTYFARDPGYNDLFDEYRATSELDSLSPKPPSTAGKIL